MQDLEIARERISEKRLTLCIVKEGEVIFETKSHGISGFLKAVEEFEDRLRGASVADRVVGKAIALLCIYASVSDVYALTLSRKAKELFEENAIHVEYGVLVENVLSPDKAVACPFENLAAGIADPRDAYRKLKALHESLKECR
jgi:hypothetical protein